jgi:hypothetical protein
MPVKVQDMPWGFVGPLAVTWYLKECGLDHHAAPIDVFYPVSIDHISLLFDPDIRIEDLTTPRTRIVHLWHERLRRHGTAEIPSSSPLGVMLSSG